MSFVDFILEISFCLINQNLPDNLPKPCPPLKQILTNDSNNVKSTTSSRVLKIKFDQEARFDQKDHLPFHLKVEDSVVNIVQMDFPKLNATNAMFFLCLKANNNCFFNSYHQFNNNFKFNNKFKSLKKFGLNFASHTSHCSKSATFLISRL